MENVKKAFALLLTLVCLMSILSGCGDHSTDQQTSSEPEEVYLTTSNLSEYLDVTFEQTGQSSTWFAFSNTGKPDIIYKDVVISYRVSAPGHSGGFTYDLQIAHDGNTRVEKGYPDENVYMEITAVRGTVLVG